MTWHDANRGWRESAAQRWAPKSPEPLRLRAWLSSPLATDLYAPIMLEGALQYAVVIRETGRAPDDVFAGCPLDAPLEQTDIPVPIADGAVDGVEIPIALASCAWFSPDAVPTVRWRRHKARSERYGLEKVRTSQSDMKTACLPTAAVTALFCDWYVCGDRAQLADLLRDVSALSSRRAGGMGDVLGWEVEPAPGPWWWWGPGGRLMRTLPLAVDAPEPHEVREAALRAPYWHPRSRRPCRVPVQRLGEVLAP